MQVSWAEACLHGSCLVWLVVRMEDTASLSWTTRVSLSALRLSGRVTRTLPVLCQH